MFTGQQSQCVLWPQIRGDAKKPGLRQTSSAIFLPRKKFAARRFCCFWRMERQAKQRGGVGSGNGGQIPKGNDAGQRICRAEFDDGCRRFFRLFEAHRQCAIAPGIFKLMAAVARQGERNGEPRRNLAKGGGLVSCGAGHQQQARHDDSVREIRMKRSATLSWATAALLFVVLLSSSLWAQAVPSG